MGNPLEDEAQRLKQKYGPRYYEQIDRNLAFVLDQMKAVPGSVHVNEALIAMSAGLPRQLVHRNKSRKSGGAKRVMGKAVPSTRLKSSRKKRTKRAYKR